MFCAEEAAPSCSAVVYGYIGQLPVPFPLPEPDGCKSGLSCPLKSGTTYTYISKMEIKPQYPKVSGGGAEGGRVTVPGAPSYVSPVPADKAGGALEAARRRQQEPILLGDPCADHRRLTLVPPTQRPALF